ncbi:hypothetical protein B4N89_20825 [Embleya scabrispora]|uniref:Uncharacterized protein n=1 Tax=Embleya scabrispora TaxID=159449 RepID=A0A1T3P1T4_9ACTN|nr:hypothetical protein [Embleya scabrispora]OPC83057.1 hypothetical protein B4N89_20825 [Embleya scabrispora]
MNVHVFRAEGLTEAQLDGLACVLCGVAYPRVSTPVGIIPGRGQVFACDPACPTIPGLRRVSVEELLAQPNPCDPSPDEVLPPSLAWVWRDDCHCETSDQRYAMEHRLTCERPGWYLVGPGTSGEWLGSWPQMARVYAERWIAAHPVGVPAESGGAA